MDYSGACLYDLHRDWQASEHAGELHWYVQPLVVEEVPSSTGMTTGTRDLVAKMNKGEVLRGADPVLLEEEAAAFLASNDTLLLLLGETGSGKSMFSWLTVHKCAHVFGAAAKGIWEVSETASGDSRGSSNSSDSGITSGSNSGSNNNSSSSSSGNNRSSGNGNGRGNGSSSGSTSV